MYSTGTASVVVVIAANHLFGTNPIGRTTELLGKFLGQEKKRNIEVGKLIDKYNQLHDDEVAGVDGRNESYKTLVNAYYELATLFYEWGWGQSFHFAYKLKGENFATSIARHEYFLGGKLGVSMGENVLDCGCGIGGPMRNIAKFLRTNIRGVTLNEVTLKIVVFFAFYLKVSPYP